VKKIAEIHENPIISRSNQQLQRLCLSFSTLQSFPIEGLHSSSMAVIARWLLGGDVISKNLLGEIIDGCFPNQMSGD